MNLHLPPPSPSHSVHSIKSPVIECTPVKFNYIPDRIYVSRSPGSALRRSTPIRRHANSLEYLPLNEELFVSGGGKKKFNNSNKNILCNNNNTDHNNSTSDNSSSSYKVHNHSSNNNSSYESDKLLFTKHEASKCSNQSYNSNSYNKSKNAINSNNKSNKGGTAKFVKEANGKFSNAIIDISHDNYSINVINNKHRSKWSSGHEQRLDHKIIHENDSSTRVVNANNNVVSSVDREQFQDDVERNRVDNKNTAKRRLLISSSELASMQTHTPRRVHTICQTEQFESADQMFAKLTDSREKAATQSAASLLSFSSQVTLHDGNNKEKDCLQSQKIRATTENEPKQHYPSCRLELVKDDVIKMESNTPLKHKAKNGRRIALHNLQEQPRHTATDSKKIASLTKLSAQEQMLLLMEESNNSNICTSNGNDNKKRYNKVKEVTDENKEEQEEEEEQHLPETQNDSSAYEEESSQCSCNRETLTPNQTLLSQERRQSRYIEQNYYNSPEYPYSNHTPQRTPLYLRFVAGKVRSRSAHPSKYEMKLNELQCLHSLTEQGEANERDCSSIRPIHDSSQSRHSTDSTKSNTDQLTRPTSRNVERVSRRIFASDDAKLAHSHLVSDLQQERYKLLHQEERPTRHRSRSTSSSASRSSNLLTRLTGHATSENAPLSPLQTKTSAKATAVEDTKTTRGLWNLFHKESFMPGTNALAAHRYAMLRSTSLQPYCGRTRSNQDYSHRRTSHLASEVDEYNNNNSNNDRSSQEQEQEEQEEEEEYEYEESNENDIEQTRHFREHANRSTWPNNDLCDTDEMNDDKKINNENKIKNRNNYYHHKTTEKREKPTTMTKQINNKKATQREMEKIERIATATPTSVLVSRGPPPRLSSNYNESDSENDVDNDDDDETAYVNNNNWQSAKVYINNKKDAVAAINERRSNLFLLRKNELRINKSGVFNADVNIDNNSSNNVMASELEDDDDDKTLFANEDVMVYNENDERWQELTEKSPSLHDSDWTHTPLSQKANRETSEAPTLPYTKSTSREFGSGDLTLPPYEQEHECEHNWENDNTCAVPVCHTSTNTQHISNNHDNINTKLFIDEQEQKKQFNRNISDTISKDYSVS